MPDAAGLNGTWIFAFHRAGRIVGTDTPHLPENGNTGNTDFFVPLRNPVRISTRRRDTGFYIGPTHEYIVVRFLVL